jgi:hypothetical protein
MVDVADLHVDTGEGYGRRKQLAHPDEQKGVVGDRVHSTILRQGHVGGRYLRCPVHATWVGAHPFYSWVMSKISLIVVGPTKPWSDMTDEEIDALAGVIYDDMVVKVIEREAAAVLDVDEQ